MTRFKKIQFYYRPDLPNADKKEKELTRRIKKNYPKINVLKPNFYPRDRKDAPNLLVILGGDGTILEAAQKFQRWNPLILGLNLGHVGFLASVREPKNFQKGVSSVLKGKYRTLPRMLINASLMRRGKNIFSTYALNDIAV